MPDREKVIRGLTVCTDNTPAEECWKCPYRGKEYCTDAVMQDALVLLKREQEPVMPTYTDPHHAYCGFCGCRIPLKKNPRYCHKCGRAVKWDA